MIVAGVGCRRGTSADELERVVRLALGLFDLPAERLEAIATESEKATEPGFPEVARRLSVKLVACTVADLDRVAGQVLTPSKLVLEAKGEIEELADTINGMIDTLGPDAPKCFVHAALKAA